MKNLGPIDEDKDIVDKKYVDEKLAYSTDEIIVGRWIDNKPIYRKIFTINAWPNATQVNMDIPDISNVDKILTVKGMMQNSVEAFTVPFYYNSSAFDSILVMIANNTIYAIRLKTNNNRSGYSGFALLEYTKTTD